MFSSVVPVPGTHYLAYAGARVGHSISAYKSLGCVRHGTGTPGIGMDVVPNLLKCPVLVLMSY